MFKRKPYRKGREYFYHFCFQTKDGFVRMSARGTTTCLKNQTAYEMHEDLLSVVISEAIKRGNKMSGSINDVYVTYYRIEEN